MGKVVDLLRVWCMWNGLIVGILTTVGWIIHFFNGTREGVKDCVAETKYTPTGGVESTFERVTYQLADGTTQNLGLVSCIGNTLRWSIGKDQAGGDKSSLGDVNFYWRKTFTFKPQEFLDLWTPCFLGILQVLQHFGEATRISWLSASWMNVLAYNVILAFWAQFGYAGNWGVVVGFYNTCGFLTVVLLLIFIDKTDGLPVLDLGTMLGMNSKKADTAEPEDGGAEYDRDIGNEA